MKKGFLFVVFALCSVLALTAGGRSAASGTQAAGGDVPETSVIRWNSGTSGNVLVTIAEERGYFAEYGLRIQNVPATANANAMMLLSTGQVDIVSNSGTSNPLQ